jgi:hypothetical protein
MFKISHVRVSTILQDFLERDKRVEKENRYLAAKQRAYSKVKEAIKSGAIERKKICAICKGRATIPHHEDYLKPLWVIWLCRKCHSLRHAGKINEDELRIKKSNRGIPFRKKKMKKT